MSMQAVRGNRAKSASKTKLDAKDFAVAQLPPEEASLLPLYCYTSPEFHQLEVERIFLKEWLCVGRVDKVEKPGDYFTLELLAEPLMVVRDERGAINVLSTVCQHRGMMVVEGQGNRRSFECPYHGWTYALDGKLIGTPLMEKSANFDRSQCPLPALQAETWEGFIFVNFDRQAPPLGPKLTGLSELIKNYKVGAMRSTKPLEFDCQWNWKMMAENFMENYHVQGLHKDTVNPVLPAINDVNEELDGQYQVVHLSANSQVDVSISGDQGFSETPPFPVIERLTPEERRKIILMFVYPSHLFFVMADSMVYYQVRPEGADRMKLRITLCLSPGAMGRPDFEQSVKAAREGIVQFNSQDMWVCRGAHRGLSSRFVRPGRLCYLEKVIWQLNRYVMKRVLHGEGTS